LGFYTDSVVLFARMKICFVRKVDGFHPKKIWRKTKLNEVLGLLNLSVGLQPINQSTRKYCVKLTENLRTGNTSQTTNKT